MVIRDVGGYPIYSSGVGLPFPIMGDSFLLSDDTLFSLTVNANANAKNMLAIINYTYGADVLVTGSGQDPLVPEESLVTQAQEISPRARTVVPGQVLKFVSLSTNPVYVSISYYSL